MELAKNHVSWENYLGLWSIPLWLYGPVHVNNLFLKDCKINSPNNVGCLQNDRTSLKAPPPLLMLLAGLTSRKTLAMTDSYDDDFSTDPYSKVSLLVQVHYLKNVPGHNFSKAKCVAKML